MSGLRDLYASAPVTPRRSSFDPCDPGIQAINPHALFDSSALFSQIVVAPAGRLAFVSGLIGCGADNMLVSPDFEPQLRQAFANLDAALDALGAKPEAVLKITEFCVNYDMAMLAPLRTEIAARFPPGGLPANTLVAVPRLGRDGALVEIESVIAL